MNNVAINFLKFFTIVFSLITAAFCFLIIKVLLTENVGAYNLILIGMLIAAIPFFIGATQTYKILELINSGKIFTKKSLRPLQIIKICSLVIGLLYATGLPYIFYVAQLDDAPGIVLIGLVFTLTSVVIFVGSTIGQKLLMRTMDIKSENKLTV